MSRLGRRRTTVAYLFMAPGLLVALVYICWPMIAGAALSLFDYSVLEPPRWVGLQNFIEALRDPRMWNALDPQLPAERGGLDSAAHPLPGQPQPGPLQRHERHLLDRLRLLHDHLPGRPPGDPRRATSLYQFPPSMVPYPITLKNYQTVWENFILGRFFLNSAIITGAGVALSVLLAALFAYPLARFQFPGRELIFFLVLIPMMVPLQGTFIINFLTTRALGMVNTYAGVVIPNAVSLFGIFLLRQAYLGIPPGL